MDSTAARSLWYSGSLSPRRPSTSTCAGAVPSLSLPPEPASSCRWASPFVLSSIPDAAAANARLRAAVRSFSASLCTSLSRFRSAAASLTLADSSSSCASFIASRERLMSSIAPSTRPSRGEPGPSSSSSCPARHANSSSSYSEAADARADTTPAGAQRLDTKPAPRDPGESLASELAATELLAEPHSTTVPPAEASASSRTPPAPPTSALEVNSDLSSSALAAPAAGDAREDGALPCVSAAACATVRAPAGDSSQLACAASSFTPVRSAKVSERSDCGDGTAPLDVACAGTSCGGSAICRWRSHAAAGARCVLADCTLSAFRPSRILASTCRRSSSRRLRASCPRSSRGTDLEDSA
eukprot:scaffold90883_cov30-Tisochrysis_lutea.AAC.2